MIVRRAVGETDVRSESVGDHVTVARKIVKPLRPGTGGMTIRSMPDESPFGSSRPGAVNCR